LARIALTVVALAALAAIVAAACASDEPGSPAAMGGATSDAEPTDAPAAGGSAGSSPIDAWPPLDGSDLPPEHAWLGDPGIWKLVPGLEFTDPCKVYEAVPGATTFPNLSWESCGTGCESADAVQGLGEFTASPVVSVHAIGGSAEPIAALTYVVETAKKVYEPRRFLSLSSGKTGAAVLRTHAAGAAVGCGAIFRKSDTSLFTGISQNKLAVSGYVDTSKGSVRWAQPPLASSSIPIAYTAIDVESGPYVFGIEPGNVWGLLDFNLHEWTLVESKSTARVGAGEGDLAVFPDHPYGGSPRLRGWRADGLGMRTLAEPIPANTCLVALTPTQVIGQTSEDLACETKQPRLWYASRSALSGGQPELTFIDLAPIGAVQIGGAGSGLKAWGNHAVLPTFDLAQTGSSSGGTAIVVIELSTAKLWRVTPNPEYSISAYTPVVDGSHLYYGESAVKNNTDRVSRFVRIDLTLLSSAPNAVPL
jgi:hypothetical protein